MPKPGRRVRKKTAWRRIFNCKNFLRGLRQPQFWSAVLAALLAWQFDEAVIALAVPVGFALEHGTSPALLGARSPARAAWWYSLAAWRGDPFAITRFGWLLESHYADARVAGPVPGWVVAHAATFAGRSLIAPYGGSLRGEAWAQRYYTLLNDVGFGAHHASAFIALEFYRAAMAQLTHREQLVPNRARHRLHGTSGAAAYNAGVLIESGRGVEGGPDPKLATQFFAVASLEHESALPHAMLSFGLRYTSNCLGIRTGLGRDYRVASGWFRRAAKAGQPDAMVNAAWMEEQGFTGWHDDDEEGEKEGGGGGGRGRGHGAPTPAQGEASDEGAFGRFPEAPRGKAGNKARALRWYEMAAATIDEVHEAAQVGIVTTAAQAAANVAGAPFVRPRPAWVPAAHAMANAARLTLELGGGAEALAADRVGGARAAASGAPEQTGSAWGGRARGKGSAGSAGARAVALYARAAALGDGEALFRMGLLTAMGRVDVNARERVQQRSKPGGCPPGGCGGGGGGGSGGGEGGADDSEGVCGRDAAVCYERAAIAGSAGGMYAWAHALRTGAGVEVGRYDAAAHAREAEIWYARAADAGHSHAIVAVAVRRRLARDATRTAGLTAQQMRDAVLEVAAGDDEPQAAVAAVKKKEEEEEEEEKEEGEDAVPEGLHWGEAPAAADDGDYSGRVIPGGDGFLGCLLPEPPPPTWAMAEAERSAPGSKNWQAPRVIPGPWTAAEWASPPRRLPVVWGTGVNQGGVGTDILVDGGGQMLMEQVPTYSWSKQAGEGAALALLNKHIECLKRRTLDGDEDEGDD